MARTVEQMLSEAATLYQHKNAMYGSSYKVTGSLLKILFPNGMDLRSSSDFNRFSILTLILGKIARYVNCWDGGNDEDTLTDIAVYAMILEELDSIVALKKDD